ncbi:MAG: hypothetical protein IJI42_04335 [Methanobrevibacter sp.]|nr:hypothetical protein [Methanobrevibacter sp.]
MYRKILIALIIVVLIVLGGLIVFSNGDSNSNTDTKINFLSNKTLQNGDSVVFELTDSKGNVLANQELKIKFTSSSGESQNFTITTDNLGKGKLVLNEQDGNYTVTVTYAGDSSHKGCSANQTITIGNVNSQQNDSASQTPSSSQSTSTSSSSSSSSSSDLKYDSELNVYYDSSGKIKGGQSDGADYNYVKSHQISGHDLE